MATFAAGNKLRLIETFTDLTGALIDPGTVSVKYAIGGATTMVQTYNPGSIVRDSLGVYHYDLDLTGFAGTLMVEWLSTGVGQAEEIHTHLITPSAF